MSNCNVNDLFGCLLQYGKVAFHLFLAATIPVRLIAHQHNVGCHFSKACGLDHGIDTIFGAEAVNDIVKRFDFARVQIFLSVLEQIKAILVSNPYLYKY